MQNATPPAVEVDVMNATKAKLGSDHPDTLISMANVAFTYWSQSSFDKAHSLLLYVAKTMQNVMGPQHPAVVHYITQVNNLLKEMEHKQCQEMAVLVCHVSCPKFETIALSILLFSL